MNGVQTRFKCKLDVKRCKRFVFPPSSLLPRSNALKTKAIRYFQTDRTLTRIVSPPLQWVFQGGTSSPLILTDGRSKSQTEKGSICREPSHIIDIFPTCLDIASAHYPDTFHNQKVKLAGTSLLPAIRKQKIQPRDLFFEHQTSCAILSDGWKLVRANGRQPWELIHLTTDPFETQDLSEQFPLKAKELENKWTRWAEQQHVYPFEYRPWTERINYYQSLYPDQKGKEN